MTQTPATLIVKNGTGDLVELQGDVDNAGVFTPRSTPSLGGLLVSAGNPLPITSVPRQLTTANADNFAVATGGVAVTVFGPGTIVNGAVIINDKNSNNGPLFIDTVHPPTLSSPGLNGTTEIILPGEKWTAPGPLVNAVQVNSENPQAFVAYRF